MYKEVKIGDQIVSVFNTKENKYVSLMDTAYLQWKNGSAEKPKKTRKKTSK